MFKSKLPRCSKYPPNIHIVVVWSLSCRQLYFIRMNTLLLTYTTNVIGSLSFQRLAFATYVHSRQGPTDSATSSVAFCAANFCRPSNSLRSAILCDTPYKKTPIIHQMSLGSSYSLNFSTCSKCFLMGIII